MFIVLFIRTFDSYNTTGKNQLTTFDWEGVVLFRFHTCMLEVRKALPLHHIIKITLNFLVLVKITFKNARDKLNRMHFVHLVTMIERLNTKLYFCHDNKHGTKCSPWVSGIASRGLRG